MGKFKRQTAHGEGYIKGFLDTGSIPVGSTNTTHPWGVFFRVGGTDAYLNRGRFMRHTAHVFCFSLCENVGRADADEKTANVNEREGIYIV